MENILSMLIFFPAAAAVVGFLIHKDSMRQFGVVVTVVEFVLSLLLWYHFDTNVAGMQFVQTLPLISSYGINYIDALRDALAHYHFPSDTDTKNKLKTFL